nr:pumilio homolog 12-like [Tanacetum cinerariifolium]
MATRSLLASYITNSIKQQQHLSSLIKRSFATTSAATESVTTPTTTKTKPKRKKKKNLFEVAQFLPNWGIGYQMAKTHWSGVAYQITKINLYKDGKHGKAWGIVHKDGIPAADAPKKISGVHKRCWNGRVVLSIESSSSFETTAHVEEGMEKLITVCNDDHKLRILLSLTDVHVPYEMVLICMSPHGTRAMQKLLENLNDGYQITLAMAALRPGAATLANDPNGHHVIQYCLIHFPSDVNEPILNEIAGKCYDVATDRSGGCVLQACIEHSQGKVRTRLVAKILANAIHLAEDPYGNYVLQHMAGLKVPEFTTQLVRRLKGNFASLSCNKFASNVVER